MAKKIQKDPPSSEQCCCGHECMHVAEYPVDLFFFFLRNCCLLCCNGTHCCTIFFMVFRGFFGIVLSLAAFYAIAYAFQRWAVFVASFVVVFIGLIAFVATTRASIVRPEEFQNRHHFTLVVKVFELVFAIGTVILLVLNHGDGGYLYFLLWVVAGVDLVLNPIEIIATFVVLNNLNKVRDVEKM